MTVRLREQVEGMRVSVTSPDGSLHAVVEGRHDVTIGMAPGGLHDVDDAEMEARLARLARLAFAARKRDYDAIREDALGPRRSPLSPRLRDERERFQELVDRVTASGASSDGSVSVQAVNLAQWAVSLAPGTTRRLDESSFVAAVNEAARRLVADHLRAVHRLRWEFFDLPRPRHER